MRKCSYLHTQFSYALEQQLHYEIKHTPVIFHFQNNPALQFHVYLLVSWDTVDKLLIISIISKEDHQNKCNHLDLTDEAPLLIFRYFKYDKTWRFMGIAFLDMTLYDIVFASHCCSG